MTTLSEKVSLSALDPYRLRVVLLCQIQNGAQQRFLDAYEEIRHRVASVPGHVSDQLCQSIEDPSSWLITSEWESAPPFLAWVDSEAHRELVKPLHGCVRDTRSLRYSVMRETPSTGDRVNGRYQTVPRVGDGLIRHAITFTVKPGSEREVAGILAGYSSPKAQVDGTTRLHRTSLFMHGNRVVRVVEVKGDLVAALRHVAMQPEVRAVEEAINPHLEQDRDLNDPDSAREFFARAAMPAVHHLSAVGAWSPELRRYALCYPVKPGCGLSAARHLAHQDELAAEDPDTPLAGSTMFLRDDLLVRVVDMLTPIEQDPVLAVGVSGPRKASVLGRLLDLGPHTDLTDPEGPKRFLAEYRMDLVTDRSSADS
jgi:heme-degrading monooxygenase HmoA